MATDPATCELFDPTIVHLPFNQPGSLRLDLMTTTGQSHTLQLNFRKFLDIGLP